jgi:hypothetical protein
MSKSTILSTGRVTAADDIITITYLEPTNSPPTVFVRWPREATPCDPAKLAAVANRVMAVLAEAVGKLAVIHADNNKL